LVVPVYRKLGIFQVQIASLFFVIRSHKT